MSKKKNLVERLANSLFREHLNRRGHQEALKLFDKLNPRTKDSISSRKQMGNLLHINALVSKLQTKNLSFLEMIIVMLLHKGKKNKKVSPKKRKKRKEKISPKRKIEIIKSIRKSQAPNLQVRGVGVKTPNMSKTAPIVRSNILLTENEVKISKMKKPKKKKKKRKKKKIPKFSASIEDRNMIVEDVTLEDSIVIVGENVKSSSTNDDIVIESPEPYSPLFSKKKVDIISQKLRSQTRMRNIPLTIARSIRKMLIGKRLSFDESWIQQGFCFSKKIPYGLIQHDGGPCGVMAVVQALLIKYFFHKKKCKSLSEVKLLQKEALVSVICDIIWRISKVEGSFCMLAIPDDYESSSKEFEIENMKVCKLETYEELEKEIIINLSMFETEKGLGVMSLVISAMLSRKMKNVKNDIGEFNSSLIVEYGYCSQELVNLLITGKAHSHVFDKIKKIGLGENETILKGIEDVSDIGYLTELEIKKHVIVGDNLKSPLYPIWIVFSESHYSVFFIKDILNDKNKEFSIHYYDYLEKLDEEVVLNLIMKKTPQYDDDEIMVLNHVIQTKWPNAQVLWENNPFM